MAPIPQTLDDETRELADNLRRREKDLVDYQIPRLHDCTGPLSVQQRLSAELREDLDVFGKQIENLEIRAEDVARKVVRLEVLRLVEEFRESSARMRKDMRAALLHSKKTIDAQAKSRREELFSAAEPASRSVEEKAGDDALMKTSNDVSEALRRTIGLMQGELERSVISHQMLEQSTATLRTTSTQHDVLSSATYASKQLVTALEKADWLDRLLILAGLALFVLVVLFILKQRVLDRGIRIAFWWTRFLPTPRRNLDLEKAGEKVNQMVQEVRSTVMASSSASVASAARASSSMTSSASGFTEVVVDSSSSVLAPSLESISCSVSDTLLDSSSSSSTNLAEDIVATALDAVSEHMEL